MGWLVDMLGWMVADSVADSVGTSWTTRRRHRAARERGRYIAQRESRMAGWLDGEVALSPGRVQFTWSLMDRTETFDAVSVERRGPGPEILGGPTEILAVIGAGSTVLVAVLRRDVPDILRELDEHAARQQAR